MDESHVLSSILWHRSAAAPAAPAVAAPPARRAVGHCWKHGVAKAGSSPSGGGVLPKLHAARAATGPSGGRKRVWERPECGQGGEKPRAAPGAEPPVGGQPLEAPSDPGCRQRRRAFTPELAGEVLVVGLHLQGQAHVPLKEGLGGHLRRLTDGREERGVGVGGGGGRGMGPWAAARRGTNHESVGMPRANSAVRVCAP